MWSNADSPSNLVNNLRHTCEQNEGMAGYGWTDYDIRTGGTHDVNDTGNHVDLITHFSRPTPNNWGLRVRSLPREDAASHQRTSIFLYLGIEEPGATIDCMKKKSGDIVCSGKTTDLGDFKFLVSDHRPKDVDSVTTSLRRLTVASDDIWETKSILSKELRRPSSHGGLLEDQPGAGNLHFLQKTFEGSIEFDVFFSSGSNLETSTSALLTEQISASRAKFRERFGLVYPLQEPFKSAEHTESSQHLLSNLMGGIGYFHGDSRVDASSATESTEVDANFWEKAAAARAHAVVEDDGPHELFSAVPSRPFFPRGFLWDEGFHLQVILDWDMDLALEVVSSWFNLMNEEGWIAREQILGPEARSKVPSEFQVQYPHYANPPTLFSVIVAFLDRLQKPALYSGAPSASTQGYRWRGRTPQHTLTSGLDDYPRAQPPHPEELHVDALSWVGGMARTLTKISNYLGETADERIFWKQEQQIIRSIEEIHWSDADQAYCDTTIGDEYKPKKVCHKGYISLLPFCFGLVDENDSHLEAVLDLIHDPVELWSPFGIRSLSTKDKYHGTDENYWRGPVWININYLILDRLLELSQQRGIHQKKVSEIYTQLRLNLVNTVFDSWKQTGFAWE
ncbi:MAG: hypothetical protein Q9168_005239 [Polycauliona sp. 1 TL-2023]